VVSCRGEGGKEPRVSKGCVFVRVWWKTITCVQKTVRVWYCGFRRFLVVNKKSNNREKRREKDKTKQNNETREKKKEEKKTKREREETKTREKNKSKNRERKEKEKKKKYLGDKG
jgi:outer membrane biosynthesis protein TonB